MADQLEVAVVQQMGHVRPSAGEEIVDADHLAAVAQKALAQVRADETGAPGHEDALSSEIVLAHGAMGSTGIEGGDAGA